MKQRGNRRRRQRRPGAAPGRREWIGGVLAPPFYVLDREEPRRPKVVVWLELPAGLVVGQAVVMPEDLDGAVGRVLRKALTEPLVGAPRRPDAFVSMTPSPPQRYARRSTEPFPSRLLPYPSSTTCSITWSSRHRRATWTRATSLADGCRPPRSHVCSRPPAKCSRRRPGRFAADTPVLRMDVPALDVEGACLSILGQATGRHGVLIFPSLDGFEAFMDAAGALEDGPIDLGSGWLALMYERAADLPPSMRRETMKHGWPV